MAKRIVNADNSVGVVGTLNKYQTDQLSTQASNFYRLKNQQFVYNDETGKGYYQNTTSKTKKKTLSEISSENTPTNLPLNFLDKLQNFFYCPPSDNLWNVQISPSENQNNNLYQIYKNVQEVNKTWKKTRSEGWGISIENSKKDPKDFLTHFCDDAMGIFLAQNIRFTPISVNYDNDIFSDLQQSGGFFKNAKIVKSRKNDETLKINFLVSNWDISEILFDPWIGAIAQQGLIADGVSLKARITLTEYSSYNPSDSSSSTMAARKQYIFDGCFPVSRDDTKKDYNQNDAGTYKNSVVTFIYDNYKINYLF